MTYTYFAPLERDLSRLVLGSMVFSTEKLDLTFELMDAWVAAGGNVVDTAHVYGGGSSERALGRWLRARGARERIAIIAKGAHHNADRKRVTPEDVTCDLRDTMARLQVDHVDLCLLHRDDPDVPVGPIVEGLNGHREAGRIGAFGGSNWSPERLGAANAYAAARGLAPFSASSPNLALAFPKETVWEGCVDACDTASRAWYNRTRLPLFAWSSQARGFFSGRFTPDRLEDPLMRRVYDSPENWARFSRAGELGERKGGYSANQVALAWVLHQPFPTYALVGPQNLEELESCVAALGIELSPAEVEWLETGRG